jgi:predicted amidohydrolase YtcJ
MLLDSGIPVGLSSDGMQIAPLNPWIHAYYATTGINALGDQVNPGQQLTRTEVLEHFTRANRWFLGGVDEDLLGTLEVGRLGDVVVLNDDYFAVSDDDLKKLQLAALFAWAIPDAGALAMLARYAPLLECGAGTG